MLSRTCISVATDMNMIRAEVSFQVYFWCASKVSAPILHCSFYMIKLKRLSPQCTMRQWLEHKTVDV